MDDLLQRARVEGSIFFPVVFLQSRRHRGEIGSHFEEADQRLWQPKRNLPNRLQMLIAKTAKIKKMQ